MWLRSPDKEGWWLVEVPGYGELFVFTSQWDNGLAFSVPIGAVSEILREMGSGGMAWIYMEDEVPDRIKGWGWKEIMIPDECPVFDMESE